MSEALPQAAVAVCVVTHDSAADLPACFASIAAQSHRPLELVVVDCASQDASREVAARLARDLRPADIPAQVLPLDENVGFAGGMNRALARTAAPLVLMLNPDARPTPDYVARLVARMGRAGEQSAGVAAVTGRLSRLAESGDPSQPGEPRRLDACGMRLVPTWRHLDRGSGRRERGQFDRPERVFGATGAASLFRRQALDDAALGGEILLTEFHTFREDAELCFRLRERGWEVLYEPAAHCDHRRTNAPGRRRLMPARVNFHTLKNRYLLRAYHQSPVNFALTLVPTLWRDLLALGYVLLRERESLAAYGWLWRNRRGILERRRLIRGRRLSTGWRLERWFIRHGLPLADTSLRGGPLAGGPVADGPPDDRPAGAAR